MPKASVEDTPNHKLRAYSRGEISFLADRLYARSVSSLSCDTPAARRDYMAASRLLRRLVGMYEASARRTLHTVLLQEDE